MELNHRGTVPLATERLLLRRLKEDDAGDMLENWANDPEVTRFLTWKPYTDVEAVRAYIATQVETYQSDKVYNWGIVFEGALIGTIGIVGLDEDCRACWIGYCIGRRWWGRGIAAEALIAVERFLFDEIGMNRVAAIHDRRNPASGRVMHKAGMLREGTLRKSRCAPDGTYIDVVHYAILKEDWENRHV